jgi:type IV fimbrial biogenesis protein FimT
MKCRQPQRGVTLIELMMTLTVLGILISLAIPSFTDTIRNNRAQAQASLLVKALKYARSEAVRRGTEVRITATSSSDWNSGWKIWVDKNGDRSFSSGSDVELQVQDAFAGGNTLTSTAGIVGIIFSNTGAVAKTYNGTSDSVVTAGTDIDFEYRVGASYCSLERDISVNFVGRVFIKRRTC